MERKKEKRNEGKMGHGKGRNENVKEERKEYKTSSKSLLEPNVYTTQ
jgi:hypothetical protein